LYIQEVMAEFARVPLDDVECSDSASLWVRYVLISPSLHGDQAPRACGHDGGEPVRGAGLCHHVLNPKQAPRRTDLHFVQSRSVPKRRTSTLCQTYRLGDHKSGSTAWAGSTTAGAPPDEALVVVLRPVVSAFFVGTRSATRIVRARLGGRRSPVVRQPSAH
jgi:hypothetical protein